MEPQFLFGLLLSLGGGFGLFASGMKLPPIQVPPLQRALVQHEIVVLFAACELSVRWLGGSFSPI